MLRITLEEGSDFGDEAIIIQGYFNTHAHTHTHPPPPHIRIHISHNSHCLSNEASLRNLTLSFQHKEKNKHNYFLSGMCEIYKFIFFLTIF